MKLAILYNQQTTGGNEDLQPEERIAMEECLSAVLKYNNALQSIGNASDYHSKAGMVTNSLDRSNLSCTPNKLMFLSLDYLYWVIGHQINQLIQKTAPVVLHWTLYLLKTKLL